MEILSKQTNRLIFKKENTKYTHYHFYKIYWHMSCLLRSHESRVPLSERPRLHFCPLRSPKTLLAPTCSHLSAMLMSISICIISLSPNMDPIKATIPKGIFHWLALSFLINSTHQNQKWNLGDFVWIFLRRRPKPETTCSPLVGK